jgi:hypothetical protein
MLSLVFRVIEGREIALRKMQNGVQNKVVVISGGYKRGTVFGTVKNR